MDESGEFSALMESVLAGNEEAFHTLLKRYGTQLRFAVRRRLHQRMRTLFDSTDFTQDVWVSFLGLLRDKATVNSPKALAGLLATLVRNKVVQETRKRLMSQKYDLNRECSLDDSSLHGVYDSLMAGEPSPSETVSRREQLDRRMMDLPVVYRRILLLLHDGQKPVEIAEELGVSLRNVRNIITKLSSRLKS